MPLGVADLELDLRGRVPGLHCATQEARAEQEGESPVSVAIHARAGSPGINGAWPNQVTRAPCKRPVPTPAEGASGHPLRGVPAAADAPLGADGGSARRVPGTAQAAGASGAPAAARAGAAACLRDG